MSDSTTSDKLKGEKAFMCVAFSNTVGLFIEMVLGGLGVKGQCKPSCLVSSLRSLPVLHP